ncbi:LysE family translocator [Aureimonas phyllosphaerae]|uniref:Threonine/homoserine/homoserine lactone efflux protein n=1 Tax=Aureimonas phyllosphaerae TaxID=1166078 RepID=A0A7W6FSD5_9HYPH|nr:LysE family translocator [Aureimonas phyllosphaerae]MBB3934019.1 threonine/homoserine/homoserine lactone efflux protein [Aureimonas phyllosphaerae]MBB3958765.1 threonine/homoserine/homoserine lactone efflux protein [Aureimonas phyllosphaerae]SFF18989.1 Threonine/homoserine/homoserine lactone efflux protein [Aureimonas phyllosphaerae]
MTFLPDLSALLAFTVAAVVLTITPGPDMTLFLGRTLAQGRTAGFAAYCGACTGSLIHTTLAAVGLSALIAASPEAFLALKVVGAAYLVWLAVQAIRHGSSLSVERAKAPPQSFAANWATGIGINLLNPKIILFFVTFLPQFVAVGDPHAGSKLFFLGVYFILVATPITVAMIFAADRIAATLKGKPAVMRFIDWLFASVFSAFAIHILLARA